MQWEFEKTLFSNGPLNKGEIPVPSYLLRFVCSTVASRGGASRAQGLTSSCHPGILSPRQQTVLSAYCMPQVGASGPGNWGSVVDVGPPVSIPKTDRRGAPDSGSSNLAVLDYSLRGQALHGAEAGGLRGL